MELLDAGDVLDDIICDDKSTDNSRKIPLETQWINEFLHVNLTAEEMKAILAKLQLRL